MLSKLEQILDMSGVPLADAGGNKLTLQGRLLALSQNEECGKKFSSLLEPPLRWENPTKENIHLDPGLHTFEGGAQRQARTAADRGRFPVRFDLVSPIAFRRWAEVYGEGSLKYPEHNWRKGMPMSNLFNHAVAHLQMWMQGDTSEDHLAHALWNIGTMIDFEETRPDLDDRHRFKAATDQRKLRVQPKSELCPHTRVTPSEKGWSCDQCGEAMTLNPNKGLMEKKWVPVEATATSAPSEMAGPDSAKGNLS